MVATWAIPVGALCGLSALAMFFFWWWFPRVWRKGNNQEGEMMVMEHAARQRHRAIIAAAQEREALEKEGGGRVALREVAGPAGEELPAPPPAYYSAPVYSTY